MARDAAPARQAPWWQQGPAALASGLQRFADDLGKRGARPSPQQPQQEQQLLGQQPDRRAPRWPGARGGAAAAPAPAAAAAAAAASAAAPAAPRGAAPPKPVDREELGRATWTLLHTLAAQMPERPSRQQQRDARALLDCLTRIYPCAECAGHFGELVRADPPDVSSGPALQQWMCRAHNTVNRALGKPSFSCELVAARWAPLDCGGDAGAPSGCDMRPGRAAARRR